MSQAPTPDHIPPHIRPITFAAAELMLDLIHNLQSYCKQDLHSVLILLCVVDATMRPFMLGEPVPAEVMRAACPPDSIRGSISRRMIADKTGLSRETVRRKTQDLANLGLVLIDSDGRVRSAQLLGTPEFQQMIEGGHKAVQRYLTRLKSYDVEMDCV